MAANKLQTNTEQAETRSQYTFTPKVDIWENTDAYALEVEMPGVDQKEIDIKLVDGILNIIGRVNAEETEGTSALYSEYESGNYERSFEISKDIDVDNIEASVKNGLLHLVLPKHEAVKPKQIEVKAS